MFALNDITAGACGDTFTSMSSMQVQLDRFVARPSEFEIVALLDLHGISNTGHGTVHDGERQHLVLHRVDRHRPRYRAGENNDDCGGRKTVHQSGR